MGDSFADSAIAAAGLAQRLGWSPDIFWSATPADLRLAMGVVVVASADGAALSRLMEAFPDG